MLPNATTVKTE